jgi:ATPases of the AAA+ class
VDFKLPGKEQLMAVLEGIANSAGILLDDNGKTELILDAGMGGTTTEFEDWLSISVVESGGREIDHNIIAREKALALKKSGILEVVNTDVTFNDLGGLDELKAWTHRRVRAFSKEAVAYHLPMPKGICIFGVQGCGKSFATKAIANELQVPLLKLDAGRLFGSLVGQSEATTREVINQVEAFGKCVLQIEELDKSFAGMKSSHDGDSGTTRRVVGTFLTWMQEKTSPVFIVATANDLTKLPPEMLRKGRWDELVFVDLPTETERVEVWRVQIRRHHRNPDEFDLSALSKITEGWSGAEIEALFNESLYAAFDKSKEPDTELIVSLSKDTAPLSKMMAAEIEALRQWANGRAKRASRVETVHVKSGPRKLA